MDGSERPRFLPETRAVREGAWRVAPPPPDLRDRRVEITGPTDAKMVINALNSGASVYMPGGCLLSFIFIVRRGFGSLSVCCRVLDACTLFYIFSDLIRFIFTSRSLTTHPPRSATPAADFEDSNCPTWDNLVGGQANLAAAVRGTLAFSAGGKAYRLKEGRRAVMVVRPRGWHLWVSAAASLAGQSKQKTS